MEELEGCVYFFLDSNKKRNIKPKKNPKVHKMVKNDPLIRNELTNVLKIQKIQNFTNFLSDTNEK
jgi:hypothetical protein